MTRRWSVAAVLAAFALSMAFDVAVAQQKWKGVATSRPTPQFAVWEWFASELPKRTDGKITGEVVSLPELGLTGFELIRVTKAGLVDFADIILAYMAGEVPALEAVDLPAIYPDFAASIKAHDAFIEAVRKYEDRLGGVVLGGYLWPGQYIVSRKPIRSPEDLKGLKIRVYGAADTDFVRALGMQPVAIAFAEVYTALERGTVDAALTGSYPAFAIKLFEVAKYIVDVNHGPNSGVLVVSKRSWDKLSADQQAALRKLGEEFSEKGWEIGRRTDKEGIDKNREKGMEFIAATPAMSAAVKKVVTEVVLPNWVKRAGDDGKAIFTRHLAPHSHVTLP